MNKKVALVVGGNGGIGSEIVNSMVDEGMTVCSTHNTKKGLNKDALQYQMDVTKDTSIAVTMKNILADHKAIDIVAFSVSLPIKNKSILLMEWGEVQKHIDIQTKGLFNIVKNLKEQIKLKHKTKFIIILTEYCLGTPPSGVSHYVTAKYSLMGLAKSMAVELSKYNTTVNMISPGMVDTNLLSTLPPKLIDIVSEKNPLKRIASPKDVSNVVLFLAKDSSDYLNGVNIPVNGGGVIL